MRNISREMLRCLCERIAAIVLFAAFLTSVQFHAAGAQVAPPLGTAQSFSVLGGSAVTNTGPTIVTGDLGVSPGSAVTGFPPGIVVGGTIHVADAVALQAQSDTTTAYNNLAGQACDFNLTDQDLGGMTLVPGVYCFSTSAQLTGALTLNAGGNPNAVWIFKIGSTLTTASSSSVLFTNGAQPCNVFWQVGSSATIGTGTTFVGNILALTSITLTTNATMSGRALARNGAVTMDSNTVAISACSVIPVTPIPPTLSKAFSPATINAGGTSTLTITLSNPDSTIATLSTPFTDTLPSGVMIATPPNAANTCGGVVTAAAGGSTVTLTGGAIPANGSCTVTVDVTAPAGGSYFNSLATGTLQTSNGSNAAPAVATLTVIPPTGGAPTLGKAFNPATINAGGTSTLTITLSNASGTPATLTAPLTDTLPSGVVIATNPNAANTCGGAVTATAGGSTVTLTGGAILANASCTVTVDVTVASGGSYFNSLAAGALQTSNGNNAAPAVATLTALPPAVVVPPSLGKAFNPATINAGGTSTLTITLSNASGTPATLTAPLTDTLPSGMVIATPPNAANTCGGAVTATAGGSTVTLTGGAIPANGSCTVTVNVTAQAAGSYVNSLGIGALQTNHGVNAAPIVVTLTVMPVNQQTGLSLTKTPNLTTYSSVGQVIIYTYVLKNTGTVPLTGPFKVTDDKLGSFACGSATSLAPGASVTCTKKYTIQASDLGNVASLPTGVSATIETGAWLQSSMSTQSMTITGATPGVPNAIYPGWCIQDHVPDDLHNQPGTLYSTIGGNLPSDVAGLPWNKVNYVLNHKIRRAGTTNLQFLKDVQTAIWVLLGELNPEFGVSAAARQMINEANAHASFVPGPGDIVAVIIYSDGMRIFPGSVQEAICEMKLLKAIVNKATGSGKFGTVVVKSGQVEVTINQTINTSSIIPADIAPKLSSPASIKAGEVLKRH